MESFLAYFGHLNIDTVLRVKKLARKGTQRIISKRVVFGGTAGNFAMASLHMGFPFNIYSAVAASTHTEYIYALRNMKINTSGIKIDEYSYGPECYIIDTGKDQVAYMNQGPMDGWSEESLIPLMKKFAYVHVSTGPPEFYLKILKGSDDSRKVYDPGQEIFYNYSKKQVIEMATIADILIFNENEYGHARGMIQNLEKKKTIIITKGANGADLLQEGVKEWIPGFKADRISGTVGAGDVFRSGFYLGLYLGMEMKDSVRLGNAAASIWVSSNDFNKIRKESVLSMSGLR